MPKIILNAHNIIFIGGGSGVGVLPDFGDGTPVVEANGAVPLMLLQHNSLAETVGSQGPFRIGAAGDNTHRAFYYALGFGPAVMILP